MSRRRRPGGRDIDGILLLDKPSGASSNQVLQTVKRLFRARKAGHTGSLDPLATGMLPICFGKATRISSFLLASDKRYLTVGQLGEATDTGDAEGRVVRNCSVEGIDRERIEAALAAFRGEIEQVPPMYSALKHKGERLYEIARRGEVVERPARRITIHELNLLGFDGNRFELDVHCSKGAYIRTLVEDIAEAMGSCAHVVRLRRTAVAPFDAEGMLTLAQLESLAEQGLAALDALLLPVDAGLAHWPELSLAAADAERVLRGQAVRAPDRAPAGMVRIYTAERRFLGIGAVADGRLAPKRLFVREPGGRARPAC